MPLEEPRITWKNDNPCSETFRDVYFSREDGLEESRYVFLKGNLLPQRWQSSGNSFTILETGFGTGLNFILTAQSFLEHAPAGMSLHYISIEKYPLNKADLRKALLYQVNPGDHDAVTESRVQMVEALVDAYPPRLCGFHQMSFAAGKIRLTLVLEDIHRGLASVYAPRGIDAFYLDGFNPATNGEMWSESVFAALKKISAANSTLATFTAAGHVRRNLEKTGFVVQKIPGFGKKREMITASLQKEFEEVPGEKPWFFAPQSQGGGSTQKKVSIIGAGLAGCALAAAFARRNWHVELIDRNKDICTEASGNPLGIFFPVVHRKPTNTDRFSLAAYLFFFTPIETFKRPWFRGMDWRRAKGAVAAPAAKRKNGSIWRLSRFAWRTRRFLSGNRGVGRGNLVFRGRLPFTRGIVAGQSL